MAPARCRSARARGVEAAVVTNRAPADGTYPPYSGFRIAPLRRRMNQAGSGLIPDERFERGSDEHEYRCKV